MRLLVRKFAWGWLLVSQTDVTKYPLSLVAQTGNSFSEVSSEGIKHIHVLYYLHTRIVVILWLNFYLCFNCLNLYIF